MIKTLFKHQHNKGQKRKKKKRFQATGNNQCIGTVPKCSNLVTQRRIRFTHASKAKKKRKKKTYLPEKVQSEDTDSLISVSLTFTEKTSEHSTCESFELRSGLDVIYVFLLPTSYGENGGSFSNINNLKENISNHLSLHSITSS